MLKKIQGEQLIVKSPTALVVKPLDDTLLLPSMVLKVQDTTLGHRDIAQLVALWFYNHLFHDQNGF